jgi:alkanesulfonate monooxygenase SsuD/methylene tetrahydromethanopterin reductase-like flavin-dependent oxidoreductase (luciferase family)
MTKERFLQEVEEGSYYVGSPETIAKKMAKTIREMGVERFDLVYGMGQQPQENRFRNIELFGKEVIPRVKELLKEGQ